MTTVIRLDTKALAFFIETMGEEFKLELTKAVLNGAASNTLKSIATQEVVEGFAEAIRKGMDKAAIEEFGKALRDHRGNLRNFEIADDLKAKIRQEVRDQAEQVVRQILSPKYLDELLEEKVAIVTYHVPGLVDKRVSAYTNKLINEEVDRRVAFALANPPD